MFAAFKVGLLGQLHANLETLTISVIDRPLRTFGQLLERKTEYLALLVDGFPQIRQALFDSLRNALRSIRFRAMRY